MLIPEPELQRLFAVPLAHYDMPDPERLCASLSELFLECDGKDEFRNSIRRDTQKGALFESRFDLFNWEQAPVRELAGYCNACLSQVIRSTSDYGEEELGQLRMDYHAWFHVTRSGGFQGAHNHPNASWSGIFCVDPGAPAKDAREGTVRFYDPRGNADYYSDPGNQNLVQPYRHGGSQVRHETGKLVIFPSYLVHEVFPYFGEDPRVIVAFNCWIDSEQGKAFY